MLGATNGVGPAGDGEALAVAVAAGVAAAAVDADGADAEPCAGWLGDEVTDAHPTRVRIMDSTAARRPAYSRVGAIS
jgi:hypothetical protein